MDSPATAAEVVRFWADAGPERWFRKDPAFDADFRTRFLATHEAAARGALDGWAATAEGALALLLLLDQFPRNCFRDTARVYATDDQARRIAHATVAAGLDRQLADTGLQRFVYLPFMHSESLADQDLSVQLNTALGDPEALRYAQHHRDIVQRFGRFPHRNAVLGRASTAEEVAFLAEGGFAG